MGLTEQTLAKGFVLPTAVTFVAPDTGDHIFLPALIDQLSIIRVGYPAARHGDQIQLSVRHGLIAGGDVLVSADTGDHNVDAAAFDIFRVVQERGLIQTEAGGVIGVRFGCAQLHDVNVVLYHAQERDGVIQGIAAFRLLRTDENLQKHVPAYGLPHRMEHALGIAAAILHAAVVFVGAGGWSGET